MGTLASMTNMVRYLKKGETGSRGPSIRGPQAWSDLDTGYQLYSGATGEDFEDLVVYNSNSYMCIKTHAKSTSILPTDTTYFRAAQKVEILAAHAVLADAIIMTDSSGNVVFKAQGGTVSCLTGEFKNVTVEGGITASTLDLATGKSAYIATPGQTIYLGALASGYARRITIVINRALRSPLDITIKASGTSVYIDKPKFSPTTGYDTEKTLSNLYDYELIGFNYNGITFWSVYQLTDAIVVTS